MTDLIRIDADGLVGLPVTLANGESWVLPAVAIASASGASASDFATAIGTPGDAAWSGTGSATVISLLKAIALNTTP